MCNACTALLPNREILIKALVRTIYLDFMNSDLPWFYCFALMVGLVSYFCALSTRIPLILTFMLFLFIVLWEMHAIEEQ